MWWRISAFCWGVAAPVMSLWGGGEVDMVMGRPASSAGWEDTGVGLLIAGAEGQNGRVGGAGAASGGGRG